MAYGARQSMNFFAGNPEIEGPVFFNIGRDGRRVDQLPPRPWAQRCLALFFWSLGLVLLLTSTDSLACSALVTLLALMGSYIKHWINLWLISCNSVQDGYFRPLMSKKDYDAQC